MIVSRLVVWSSYACVALVCVCRGSAQDTVRIAPVEVLATSERAIPTGMAITRITPQMIDVVRPLQLSDLLQSVPSLFVKDYGGIGGLKSISLRGGSAAQSLLMLDDVTWNSAQQGMSDLSTIPMAFVRSVTVERGALSALYGANAMTGVVRVGLGVPNHPLRAVVESGSFQLWRVTASGTLPLASARLGIGIDTYGTQGSYSYTTNYNDEAVELTRQNADVRSYAAMARIELASGWNVTALARDGDRGVPGAVVQGVPSTQPRARMHDQDAALMIHTPDVMLGSITVAAHAGVRYSDQHYTDPDATYTGPGGIDARFLLRDLTVSLVARMPAPEDVGAVDHHLRLDGGAVDLRGTSLQPSVGDRVDRTRLSLSYTATTQVLPSASVQATLRGDHVSDAGSALTGLVGGSWQASTWITMRGSVGTGFRPASFNELYFLNYGTADLAPERSTTASLGAMGFVGSSVAWSLDVFATDYRNLIVAVPLSPVVTSAQNVGGATARGIEATIDAEPIPHLQVQWSYTLQSVVDRTGRAGLDGTAVPYVPVELIYGRLMYGTPTMRGGFDWQYTSYRYAQGGGELTGLLQPFHVVNMLVATRVPGRVLEADVLLRVENLLDARYQVVRGFPMPGRVVRLSLEVGL